MRKVAILGTMCAVLLMLALPVMAADYVGSETCKKCHADNYNDFRASGHPYKLQPVENARSWKLPLPKGWDWDDISYVIGGAMKKSRYIDKKGYIVTTAKDGSPAPTQYNLETGFWVNYHPGEKKPYTCGSCHTTGFKKEGNQDGLEGLKGTWALPGVQCEACHGPASDHVKKPKKAKLAVDTKSSLCGQCHIRGDKDTIPAKGGFIRHHEQYNEWLASPHKDQTECADCHDPHKTSKAAIKVACADCHDDAAEKYARNIHAETKIDCVECHMPRATKSAVKFDPAIGDVRTHIWRINDDADYSMFTDDGKFAKDAISLKFACLDCHKSRDQKWAAAKSKAIHD